MISQTRMLSSFFPHLSNDKRDTLVPSVVGELLFNLENVVPSILRVERLLFLILACLPRS